MTYPGKCFEYWELQLGHNSPSNVSTMIYNSVDFWLTCKPGPQYEINRKVKNLRLCDRKLAKIPSAGWFCLSWAGSDINMKSLIGCRSLSNSIVNYAQALSWTVQIFSKQYISLNSTFLVLLIVWRIYLYLYLICVKASGTSEKYWKQT